MSPQRGRTPQIFRLDSQDVEILNQKAVRQPSTTVPQHENKRCGVQIAEAAVTRSLEDSAKGRKRHESPSEYTQRRKDLLKDDIVNGGHDFQSPLWTKCNGTIW